MVRRCIAVFTILIFPFLLLGNSKSKELFQIDSKLIMVKHFDHSINSEICNNILESAIKGEKKYKNNDINIMRYSPKVLVDLGQKAEMVLSSNAQYFETVSAKDNTYKLRTLSSEEEPGMNLSLVFNKIDANEFVLNYLLKLRFINGREKLKNINIEVGKPRITTISSDNKVNVKLNDWILIAKKKLELTDDKNAVVLIAVKISKHLND
jgi:hypothetical protein